MFKRIMVVAAVLVAAGLAASAFAPAASAEERERGGVLLGGAGELDARGDGLVALKGRMRVDVSADAGVLLVMDIAGDADVQVSGHGETGEWRGFKAYFGFDGEASISGSHVAVVVLGRNIALGAEGKGWAYLKGQGTFTVNERGPFRWTDDGAFAAVEPAS